LGDRAGQGPCPGARRHVSAAILYGSFAHGDFHEGSDLAGDVRDRFHEAGRLDLPGEPICCTGEVFAEPVRSANPLIREAPAEGVRV